MALTTGKCFAVLLVAALGAPAVQTLHRNPEPPKASPAQPFPSLSLEAIKTPAAAASEPESATESASQRLSLALSPYAGDGLQIARTFEGARPARPRAVPHSEGCLLYTSDAADDNRLV